MQKKAASCAYEWKGFCELSLAEKTPNILESVQDKLLDLSDPR